MVKLKSLLAISGGMAVTATAEGIRPSIMKSDSRRLDGMTTEDLELETRQFVESNIGKIRIMNNNSGDGKGRRRLKGHEGPHDDDDDVDDDEGSTDVEPWSEQHKHSGKSGKGSTVASDPDPDELFYLLPVACPKECISSYVGGTYGYEMSDSVYECDELDTAQMWLVRSDSSYIQIESYDCPDMCIAVDYERGDNVQMVEETCYNGVLTLKDCNSEFGTEWYFTGGQLVNSFCWGMGMSSIMTIPMNGGVCTPHVAVTGLDEDSLMKSDTFMFVNRLPNSQPCFDQGIGTPYIEEAAMPETKVVDEMKAKVDEKKTKVDEKNGRR